MCSMSWVQMLPDAANRGLLASYYCIRGPLP